MTEPIEAALSRIVLSTIGLKKNSVSLRSLQEKEAFSTVPILGVSNNVKSFSAFVLV